MNKIKTFPDAHLCDGENMKDKKAGCVYGYLLAIRFFGNRHLDVDYISEKYPSGRCGNIGSQFREKNGVKNPHRKRPGGITFEQNENVSRCAFV